MPVTSSSLIPFRCVVCGHPAKVPVRCPFGHLSCSLCLVPTDESYVVCPRQNCERIIPGVNRSQLRRARQEINDFVAINPRMWISIDLCTRNTLARQTFLCTDCGERGTVGVDGRTTEHHRSECKGVQSKTIPPNDELTYCERWISTRTKNATTSECESWIRVFYLIRTFMIGCMWLIMFGMGCLVAFDSVEDALAWICCVTAVLWGFVFLVGHHLSQMITFLCVYKLNAINQECDD